MKRINLLIFLPFIFVMFSKCTGPTKNDGQANGVSATLDVQFADSTLDSYFSQKFRREEPGGAVLVKVGDTILISKGFGLSDLRTLEKASQNTLFNLGLISKTFVANAILILQSNRKLSVEDNLLKYFPEFQDKNIGSSVKIKHLLTHTSGLPDIRFPAKDSVFYLSAKDKENWEPIMKASSLNFEPGSQFEYSNPAFNALALIIEKIDGRKWQESVTGSILIPSGMLMSTITDGPHPETGVAHGYIKIKNQWIEKDYGEEPTFAAAGNGGVWSSVEELALYAQALSSNTFLTNEVHSEATTVKKFPNWNGETAPQIGWSWFIGKTSDGYKTVGHTGSQGGFRSNYLSIPEKKWLIVILSAAPKPLEEYTTYTMVYLQNRN